MHVVEGISDRVVALDHGVKIAEGTFEAGRDERARRRGLPRPEGDGDEVSANGNGDAAARGSTAVDTYYGPIHILQGIDAARAAPGELVCLLGGNASGKSTTLKTILGIVAAAQRHRRVRRRGRDEAADELPDPQGHGDRARRTGACSRR